jgi:hypothetical protein
MLNLTYVLIAPSCGARLKLRNPVDERTAARGGLRADS